MQEQQWLHSACSHRKETEILLTGCQTCRLSTRKSIHYKATFAFPRPVTYTLQREYMPRVDMQQRVQENPNFHVTTKKLL